MVITAAQLSERTAWLSAPYVGLGNFRGLETTPREQFYEKALKAHRAGWQIGAHANGDLAIARYVRFHGAVMHFYGEDRLKKMFAMRDFIDAGIHVPSSSDYGASPPEPMLWLQSQVTRTDFTGHPWGLNQRITIRQAIECGTRNGAYASFEEHLKGSLRPGRLADLVVWDHDILKIDPTDLARTKAERTMVDGRWVYES